MNGQSLAGCTSSALPNVTGTVAKCVSSCRIQALVWGQIGSSAHRATLNKCFDVCRVKTVSTGLSMVSVVLCRSASLFHQDLVRERAAQCPRLAVALFWTWVTFRCLFDHKHLVPKAAVAHFIFKDRVGKFKIQIHRNSGERT